MTARPGAGLKGDDMTLEEARYIAGRVWCDQDMRSREMCVDTAEAIARVLYAQYQDNERKKHDAGKEVPG